MTKADAERRLAQFSMDDLPVAEVPAVACPVSPDWFKKFKELRREFMRGLGGSIEDLSFLTLSQAEFMGLITGERLPENLTIRWRVPLVYGGKLEIDNMFMCVLFPYGKNLDLFIAEQMGAKTIWLPNPKKKVYLPAHIGGGGDGGGNATDDRLSQLAATMNVGRE